ncbi:MAG: L-iditol 2-dehydrogenase [Candidatus Symbiobacter sp.]|nr:L-iditol 2-dehydrogenase [Candidatus Symbiobacter sp.]
MRVKEKCTIVTGGARGIGAAIARAFADEGASVCLADANIDLATTAADVIIQATGNTNVFALPLDVTKTASIAKMVADVEQRCGGIDILINNAAIFDMAPLAEISEASYERVFAVNVKGLLFTMQHVANSMRSRGRGGKIINIASQAGRRGESMIAVYCASKAAVISLTQSVGLELIKYGINVNGIAPGVVDTPMWDVVDTLFAKYENRSIGEKKLLVGQNVPYGRMGKPEDHIGCALFLASSESDYVVAQTINVDGGQWMS